MKENKKGKLLFGIIASCIILLIVFLSLGNVIGNLKIGQSYNTQTLEETYYLTSDSVSEDKCKYLSDIDYDATQSTVEWGSITKDSNLETQHNNGLITLIVDNKKTYFLKGVSAHATSKLVYDISDQDYDYFSTYYGVDESRGDNGNGVKFYIYTSKDGQNWDLKTDKNPKVLKGKDNAEYIKIDLTDVNYLKLECNNNGNNASDHSVYANAKLCKNDYVEKKPEDVDFIKTVEQYDAELKDLDLNNIDSKELTLLRRTFVNNVGYDLLIAIVNLDKDYEDAVRWLMGDVENLRLYVLGGAPDGGSYYNSIKELSRLYKAYKDDFTVKTKTNNIWEPNLTKGEVYKKMAISLSLTHATKVGYWAQIDHPKNRSDSVERYRIYKKLYDEGKFIVARTVEDDGTITPIKNEDGTPRLDHTPWFETLKVEEMRYVMNNITDDEELEWLNAYTQKRIDNNPKQEEKYLQPHTYIAYIWPNFEEDIFHLPEYYEHWDQYFEGIFSKYHVSYSTENDHVYKAWMSMRNDLKETGAVCGGISKLGCHIRAAHGTPASVISQPGHAALIYYRKDKNGKGYWSMDNDVSGWAQSGKSEKMNTRMPLGWGDDSYVSGWAATYMMLSQDALNDFENYEKSEKIMMMADLYKGNVKKQEEIYEAALKAQKINIDAWWGLINSYNADDTKTEADYYELATRLGNALMPYPLPMKNLLDQIEPKMESVKYSFEFTILETKLLNDGKAYSKENRGSDPDISGITRTVANFLLGQVDTTLANFSFDGIDAEKIVLSNRFDGVGVRWDYSLDGGQNWKEVYFSADADHKWKLTKKEIGSITKENDILIHIVGTDYKESNIYKIDIEDQSLLNNLYANDLENRVVGVDLSTQWRYTENDDWTSYSIASPDLTGNKTVQVRQAPSGTKLASPASEMYEFTEDNQKDTRKYIRVSELSVAGEEGKGFSTQSQDAKRPHYAPNAIDGNRNTLWHTDFKYSVLEQEVKPFYIIELSEPKYVSALEFAQTKYVYNDRDGIKNVTVSVSTDNENWVEAGKIEDCKDYDKVYDITFKESIYAKYVKLDIETYDIFASISMINLYEDVTKIDRSIPTAGIYYSTKEPTSGYVIARLDNPSTDIIITNNDGSDTHIFRENGEFKFEFEDKNGNKGSATAKVDWIDTEGPTANVEYDLDGNRKLRILLDSISEDVYLLDEENRKINFIEVKDKKVSKISFIDSSNNVYKIIELEADGKTTSKITYKNTTGRAKNVDTYVTIIANDQVVEEQYLDNNGISVDVSEADKESFSRLRQVKTNPLEYTFEDNGNYEFKLLDKASNIAYKSIKVDYLEDNNVMASDISYDITKVTNNNVVATINPYIINENNEKLDVTITNNEASKQYTFEKNGEFTFKYKDAQDTDDAEVKEHKAKVSWIDKTAPTAVIKYSTKNTTNDPVTAHLTDESEEIIVTNNGTNRQYTFEKNGDFTFEFEDEAGNKGIALAAVDWIEQKQQSPSQDASGDINGDGKVTATDILLIKRHLVAGEKQEWVLTEQKFKAADMNSDGQITATDLIQMKRKVLSDMEAQ